MHQSASTSQGTRTKVLSRVAQSSQQAKTLFPECLKLSAVAPSLPSWMLPANQAFRRSGPTTVSPRASGIHGTGRVSTPAGTCTHGWDTSPASESNKQPRECTAQGQRRTTGIITENKETVGGKCLFTRTLPPLFHTKLLSLSIVIHRESLHHMDIHDCITLCEIELCW
jgi:hypothetical protein